MIPRMDIPHFEKLTANLAAIGVSVSPDAQLVRPVLPQAPDGETEIQVIGLDLLSARVPLEYEVHGLTACVVCEKLCFLGCESVKGVASGEYIPMCRACAERYIMPVSHGLSFIEDV